MISPREEWPSLQLWISHCFPATGNKAISTTYNQAYNSAFRSLHLHHSSWEIKHFWTWNRTYKKLHSLHRPPCIIFWNCCLITTFTCPINRSVYCPALSIPNSTRKLCQWIVGRQHLNWSPSAQNAVQQLKDCFTTTPIPHHPDPNLGWRFQHWHWSHPISTSWQSSQDIPMCLLLMQIVFCRDKLWHWRPWVAGDEGSLWRIVTLARGC